MAKAFQVTMDCADPRSIGGFWSRVLDYHEDPPPEPFASWREALTAWGVPEEMHNSKYAIVDPDGSSPRLFFQQVPEVKIVKNRLHLDVRVTGLPGNDLERKKPILDAEAERLIGFGATVVRTVHDELDYFMVLQDPEGNEFCIT
jgi:Glyoxalase-like domain